jgi:hypothetical protein
MAVTDGRLPSTPSGSRKKTVSPKKVASPRKAPSPKGSVSPKKSLSPKLLSPYAENVDPRVKAFMEVPENIAHLEMLAEDIPTPEGLKRLNYCRCKFACLLDSAEANSLHAILGEAHRGKRTVRNKVI